MRPATICRNSTFVARVLRPVAVPLLMRKTRSRPSRASTATSYPVYVRLAELDGRIYLDLADADWRVVEIDDAGWRVISNPPVRFRRPRGLQPLPEPVGGGSIADLATFVNVNSEEDFRLCVMWELQALRGRGPYPIIVLTAEQGAAENDHVTRPASPL